MAWLDTHPPRTPQFRCPRRRKPSGIIGVHTAESIGDESGPDTGAENVADFIRRRTNYGSYHLLADSDSIIQLVRFECVAYHIATHSLNEHTIGISAAAQAAKWNSYGAAWKRDVVRNMARAAARAAKWLKKEHGITVPAKRISLSQALAGAKGFLAHGDADPDRRTDPGSTFPWGQFLSDYAAIMGGTLEEEPTLSWNENLTPGTSGNDITKFANDTIPKGWGRHAADLLGYAAASLAYLSRVKFSKPGWPDESLTLKDFIRWIHTWVKRTGELVKGTVVPMLKKQDAKLDAILQAVEGTDQSTIIAAIEERHSIEMAQLQQAEIQRTVIEDKLDAVSGVLEAHANGEIDEAQVVEGIRQIFVRAGPQTTVMAEQADEEEA